jgi:Cu+-exporting ATPase
MSDATRTLLDVQSESAGCSCCGSGPARVDSAAAERVIDPVCGMTVDPTSARASSTHQGQVYYFCARGCQRAFEEDPDRYLTGAS